jgi:hypothetical protein
MHLMVGMHVSKAITQLGFADGVVTYFVPRNRGWDINPLVPGWVPGQRKPDSQSVWFCLILEPGFLLFFGTWLIFEVPNPAAEENCLHFSIFDRETKIL